MNRKLGTAISMTALAALALQAGCESAGIGGGGPAAGAKSTVSIIINNLGMTFPSGMDENHNPYLDYIKEKTGLDIQVTTPPQEVYEEKLNMIMSSGKVPDLIHVFDQVWMDSYVKLNALQPLDEWIDRYGPDLKAKIPKEAWDRVRYNGRIYAVPSLNEAKGIEIVYARKDWLDRLGLKPPVTLEEYEAVIRAFTREDPDGNGANDTIGLILTEDMGRSAPFFGAFGTQLDSWVERNGSLVNGSTLPETKQTLAYLRKLYAEKLLDPEFPLNRNSSLVSKIADGRVGLFSATWYDTRGPIAANKRKDPKAEWIPLAYPTGPNGHKGVYDKNMIRGYNVVPAGASNPETAVKLLNFIAGEGNKTLKLGFENQIWRMVGGHIVTDFAEHDKHLYRGIYQAMVDVVEDPWLYKERLDSLGDFHLYNNLKTIEANLIPNLFYGTPTPAMTRLDGKLIDLKEAFTRIVMGVDPLDAFDQYVEQWRREGGDEITGEVNEWYKGRQAARTGGGTP